MRSSVPWRTSDFASPIVHLLAFYTNYYLDT
jgi:hypothetical protein